MGRASRALPSLLPMNAGTCACTREDIAALLQHVVPEAVHDALLPARSADNVVSARAVIESSVEMAFNDVDSKANAMLQLLDMSPEDLLLRDADTTERIDELKLLAVERAACLLSGMRVGDGALLNQYASAPAVPSKGTASLDVVIHGLDKNIVNVKVCAAPQKEVMRAAVTIRVVPKALGDGDDGGDGDGWPLPAAPNVRIPYGKYFKMANGDLLCMSPGVSNFVFVCPADSAEVAAVPLAGVGLPAAQGVEGVVSTSRPWTGKSAGAVRMDFSQLNGSAGAQLPAEADRKAARALVASYSPDAPSLQMQAQALTMCNVRSSDLIPGTLRALFGICFSDLSALHLINVKLRHPAVLLLADAVSTADDRLVELRLERCSLNDKRFELVHRALARNAKKRVKFHKDATWGIRKLCLKGNLLTYSSVAALAKSLSSRGRSRFEVIDLSCNRLGGRQSEAGGVALAKLLNACLGLDILNLRGCSLGSCAMRAMEANVAEHSALRVLNVRNNKLGNAPGLGHALTGLLAMFKHLEALHLGGNRKLYPSAVEALAGAVRGDRRSNIRTIHLQNVGLTPTMLGAVAAMLEDNRSVCVLNIYDNAESLRADMGSATASLANLIRTNVSVQVINAYGCGFDTHEHEELLQQAREQNEQSRLAQLNL